MAAPNTRSNRALAQPQKHADGMRGCGHYVLDGPDRRAHYALVCSLLLKCEASLIWRKDIIEGVHFIRTSSIEYFGFYLRLETHILLIKQVAHICCRAIIVGPISQASSSPEAT